MLVLALASIAFPCAGLLTEEGGRVASSDAQQALFRVDTGGMSVEYRVRYDGDAENFAWVIPVPGPVKDVEVGDELTFESAVNATAPQIYVKSGSSSDAPTCGCGGASDKGGVDSGSLETGDGVVVVGGGYAGAFEYVVLDASSGTALNEWLAENGYAIGGSQGVVDSYVDDPLGFQWVAVKIRPDTPETPTGGVFLDPLRIHYGEAADGALHAQFPSRMAQVAMVTEVRTEIYVFAEGYADIAGWTAATNDDDGYDLTVEDGESADAAYTTLLRDLGTTTLQAWPVWSGQYTDPVTGRSGWLTRYDSITIPAANTVDAAFVDSSADGWASTSILLDDTGGGSLDTLGFFLVPGALGLGALARRRRR